jgi:hypothetical protein
MKKFTPKFILIIGSILAFICIVAVGLIIGYFLLFNQNSVQDANGKTSLSIKVGDQFTLSTNYKASTGYSTFPPVYDSSVFQLVSSTDGTTGNGMPGGDSSTKTYTFKALTKSTDSKVEVGIYRAWDAANTKIVQQSIKVTVN